VVDAMSDKILISNNAALQSKYGKKGLAAVLAAVRALVAADRKRGLVTQLIDISSAAAMKKHKGKAVTTPGDDGECKDAVDAIYAALKPDFLVLLDAPDVIPHFKLTNPVPKDKDGDIPSDLPYASDAPSTSRDTAKYAAVTRVVGRLPGLTGADNPEYLVALLEAAAGFKSLKRANYMPAFALSAAVWQKSTALSVNKIFGAMQATICPPTGTPGVQAMLAPLSHFINCHGAEVDPQFYGEQAKSYPISMTSADVAKGNRKNAIIAAECCFGAQLYDPSFTGGKLPISNAYLRAGAIGYFGSTTTAYGPAEGNSAADLITQYFLIRAMQGASLGRACLQARQQFVMGEKMEDPVNVKTLAQFLLLGDPSLHPCLVETADAASSATDIDASGARKARRVALGAFGKAAADSSGFPGRRIASPPKKLHDLVQQIASKRGLSAKTEDIEAFRIVGGEDYGKEMKAHKVAQQVVVVTDHHMATKAKGAEKGALPKTKVLVAHAQDDRVIKVVEYVRR